MPAPALAPFQQDAVDALIGGLDRDEGAAVLLEAPTGSGKTLMLGRAAAEIARRRSVVWFWFAPFAAVIDQTTYALAQTCGGLRLRDLVGDRHADLAAEGDVYVTTWAAVAARDSEARRLRRDSDEGPALDRFIDEVRSRGLRLGAVIDEAHHSFRARAQAFAFCRDVLRPDLLMLATATPRDADVEIFRQETGIERLARVTVPRREAVAARLVKRGLRLVVFNASAQDRAVVDFAELALRAAWERHQAIRAALAKRGATMTPLLLVQADSADWTPGRVRAYFTEELHLPESEIAVHTASEPDSDLAAAVKDGGVGVLVFKMAVATGFDAPRAFTL
ncbi:MAG: DEAD/DEAH box helicase, partial [Alphaproteobacteria bacterium]|nr:DEAD/DEAH box helicase [Alphaproteobacteria bacterium]